MKHLKKLCAKRKIALNGYPSVKLLTFKNFNIKNSIKKSLKNRQIFVKMPDPTL